MNENINEVTEEVLENVAAEEVLTDVADKAVETIESVADENNALSIILIVVAAIGLIATGGWVIWLGFFIAKKIKAKIAASKVEIVEEDDFFEEEETTGEE